ncbi:nucleotidyltransferase [Canicola haemoglobinophilus]|uniref:Nucleotidyltransferase substrate binding protein n=1 Tax=Canicola haemoglobinophilus TaxID=733 RepID=A0A1V4B121_9PAST|nr:nucleotidyltransferase substrate binding protein [Canicola haemoglobinophilus]MBN6710401.1 nucleotidyltransferase substrate binding protein [Canicola haemoglobinophilus]OOS00442.1 nucleotidyltransferase [Canicola haemoglobinophilus]STO59479.1 nucleotidyltransferase substrate binding protein [Canicola haemoglobinophilus]
MQQDIRWKQRFDKYKQALHQLESAVLEYADTEIDIIKEGIIQRFEFTHELAWKVMQDYLKAQGEVDVFGSKIATRLAFNRELINQGEIWLDMIETRNITVHTYDEKILNEQFNKVVNNYLPLFLQFQQRLEKLCQISD